MTAQRHELRVVWHDPAVDHSSRQEIIELLHGLLIRLDDRLPGKDITLTAEFTDVGEFGLALEQLADVLCEDDQPLAADERADMLTLVDRMQINDRVPRALALCPDK